MWLTTKTGKHFNTDWISESKKKNYQIEKTEQEGNKLNEQDRINDLPKIKNLKEYEKNIQNLDIEHTRVVDKDGNTLIADKSSNMKNKVFFTPDEIKKMSDAVLTHNHPNGITFGEDDLNMLVQNNLQEIRAVARYNKDIKIGGQIYSLKKSGGGTSKIKNRFAIDYEREVDAYARNVLDKEMKEFKKKGRWTSKEWNYLNKKHSDYRRQWLKDNSEKYGYIYTEED